VPAHLARAVRGGGISPILPTYPYPYDRANDLLQKARQCRAVTVWSVFGNSSCKNKEHLGYAKMLSNKTLKTKNYRLTAGLPALFVACRQFMTSFCAACCEYAASVCRCHTGTESVLICAFAAAGLVCTLHDSFFLYI